MEHTIKTPNSIQRDAMYATALENRQAEPSSDSSSSAKNTKLIARVMQQTDDLVIVIDYQGKDGAVTRRVVSPIRFVGSDRFLALCLSREEPRQFYIDKCRSVRADLAGNYVMPVELLTLN